MESADVTSRAKTAVRVSWIVSIAAVLNLVAAIQAAVWLCVGRLSGSWETGLVDVTQLPQVVVRVPLSDVPPDVVEALLVDLPIGLRAVCAAPSVIVAAMLVLAATMLGRFLTRIGAMSSFGPGAQRELGALALILVVGSVAATLVNLLASLLLTQHLAANALVQIAYVDVPAIYVVLGAVAVALRYALRDGAALEKEVDGVV